MDMNAWRISAPWSIGAEVLRRIINGFHSRAPRNTVKEMSLRLLLVVVAFAGLTAVDAAAAPRTTRPVTEVAIRGTIRAQLSYVKVINSGFTSYRNLRLVISRSGHVVRSIEPRHSGTLKYLWPGGAGRTKSVHVADLDGDRVPEIEVDLYSGGAHCCRMLYAYRWNGAAYVAQQLQSGSFGYSQRDLDQDGRPEWVSVDPRFEYLFTSFAASGVPLRIYDYRQGVFTVITDKYPSLIRTDAARWWGFYQQQRTGSTSNSDNRGLLAAWAADTYLLGEGDTVWPALNTAYAQGDLNGPPAGSPTGLVYIDKLRQKLREFGYLH
jgi:hypothetical protein